METLACIAYAWLSGIPLAFILCATSKWMDTREIIGVSLLWPLALVGMMTSGLVTFLRRQWS